ncbi:hypothetical protein ACF07V_03770 [Streptomyces sp. NPDC015661]|uniref:hypothetical protein n=1 Tax=Streptomyces sp. NPDC015661 TaxID=3364961 RepID=UPI0036FC46CD
MLQDDHEDRLAGGVPGRLLRVVDDVDVLRHAVGGVLLVLVAAGVGERVVPGLLAVRVVRALGDDDDAAPGEDHLVDDARDHAPGGEQADEQCEESEEGGESHAAAVRGRGPPDVAAVGGDDRRAPGPRLPHLEGEPVLLGGDEGAAGRVAFFGQGVGQGGEEGAGGVRVAALDAVGGAVGEDDLDGLVAARVHLLDDGQGDAGDQPVALEGEDVGVEDRVGVALREDL